MEDTEVTSHLFSKFLFNASNFKKLSSYFYTPTLAWQGFKWLGESLLFCLFVLHVTEFLVSFRRLTATNSRFRNTAKDKTRQA